MVAPRGRQFQSVKTPPQHADEGIATEERQKKYCYDTLADPTSPKEA